MQRNRDISVLRNGFSVSRQWQLHHQHYHQHYHWQRYCCQCNVSIDESTCRNKHLQPSRFGVFVWRGFVLWRNVFYPQCKHLSSFERTIKQACAVVVSLPLSLSLAALFIHSHTNAQLTMAVYLQRRGVLVRPNRGLQRYHYVPPNVSTRQPVGSHQRCA